MFKKACNQYYGYLAKILYRAERILSLKEDPSYAKYEAKLVSYTNNMLSSYNNLAQIKAEVGLDIFNFNNHSGHGFSIEDYRLVGNLEKAHMWAKDFMSKCENPLESNSICEKYEISIFIMHCLTIIPDDITYIESKHNKSIVEPYPVVEEDVTTTSNQIVQSDSSINMFELYDMSF